MEIFELSGSDGDFFIADNTFVCTLYSASTDLMDLDDGQVTLGVNQYRNIPDMGSFTSVADTNYLITRPYLLDPSGGIWEATVNDTGGIIGVQVK